MRWYICWTSCALFAVRWVSSVASIPNKLQKLKYLTSLPVMFTFRSSTTSPPPAVNMSTHCEAQKKTDKKGAWLYSNPSMENLWTGRAAVGRFCSMAAVTVQPSSAVGALSSYHLVRSVPPVSAGCVPYGISHHLVTLRPGRSSSRCRFTSKTGQQLLNWATYLMSRCFILLASTAAKPFAIVVFTIIIRCHKGF